MAGVLPAPPLGSRVLVDVLALKPACVHSCVFSQQRQPELPAQHARPLLQVQPGAGSGRDAGVLPQHLQPAGPTLRRHRQPVRRRYPAFLSISAAVKSWRVTGSNPRVRLSPSSRGVSGGSGPDAYSHRRWRVSRGAGADRPGGVPHRQEEEPRWIPDHLSWVKSPGRVRMSARLCCVHILACSSRDGETPKTC